MIKIIAIEGMTCGHCTGRVDKALSSIDGVSKVEMNLEEKKATVAMDTDINDKLFKQKIEDAGYKAVEIKSV